MDSNTKDEISLEEQKAYYKILLPSVIIIGIIIFTFYHGDNKDIVSHISLASSFVSIGFAITAIIYSYYLNRTQRSDSDNLQTQISKLNYVVEKIDKSNEKLSKIDSMIDKLDLSMVQINDIKGIVNKLYTKNQIELDNKESELGTPVTQPPVTPKTEMPTESNDGKETT